MAPKSPKDGAPSAPHQPETLEAALIALDEKEARIAHLQGEADRLKNDLAVAGERITSLTDALEAKAAALAQRDSDLTKAGQDLEKARGATRMWPDEETAGRRMAARALGIDPAEILAWRVSDDGRTVTVTTVDGRKLDNRA